MNLFIQKNLQNKLLKKHINKKTQQGGSSKSAHNNTNNNLKRRLLELHLPDVPTTHTKPIPKSLKLIDVQHYINEITKKQIPTRHQLDENTEKTTLFNLMKLANFRDDFETINSIYACIDFIINSVGDKIIQLSKMIQEPKHSRNSGSVSKDGANKVIRAWIEFFMDLQKKLEDEKNKIQRLL